MPPKDAPSCGSDYGWQWALGKTSWVTSYSRPSEGVDTLKELLRCCDDWGIKVLTAYAFSTENWGRPSHEVEFLLTLFERVLRRELAEMMRKNVRIRFLGDLKALPPSLQAEIAHAMEETRNNQGIQFNVATNYGSRQEIVQACKQIALKVKRGEIDVEDIDEQLFENHLYTQGISPPIYSSAPVAKCD